MLRDSTPGSNLAAAAEAAGPAVSEVFLTVLPRRSRNGCERGKGQGEGQNDLRHDGLLWLLSAAGRMADRPFVVLGRAPSTWPDV